MRKKMSSSKKTIIALYSILVAIIVAFTAITFAWFTNSASFNSSIEFGTIQLDTTSGTGTQTALTKSVTRSIG